MCCIYLWLEWFKVGKMIFSDRRVWCEGIGREGGVYRVFLVSDVLILNILTINTY